MLEPPGSYMALDRHGHPAFFVPVEERASGPSLQANVVSLRPSTQCVLFVQERESVSGEFHVLQCKSSDPATVDTFVLLLDALLGRLRSDGMAADYLTTFFRALVRLFNVGASPDPAKERQGLWGELLLMRLLGGASAWAPFWHTDPYSRFDFSAGLKRTEVKTTVGDARVHSFSHKQLFTTGREQVAIASLLLREDPQGLALNELIEESREELSGDPMQLAKLEAAIRSARMGDREERGPSFDESDAKANLAWFWAHEAPRFTQPEPPGVSEARYKADLSTTPHIPNLELACWLGAWRQPSEA